MRGPTTKRQFYREALRGNLGNYPRAWETLQEVQDSGWSGTVGIRNLTLGAPVRYHVPVERLEEVVGWYGGLGYSADLLRYSEGLPDETLLLQGDLCLAPWGGGLLLEYNLDPGLSHREALAKAETAVGLRAQMILREVCWPSSWAMLETLLGLYPAAVLEVGVYGVAVGPLRGHNTVVWEVRDGY